MLERANHSATNIPSSAGFWLLCFRRWRTPQNIEDREALEREYASLSSAFPRFATACSTERFLVCIAGVHNSWVAKLPEMVQHHQIYPRPIRAPNAAGRVSASIGRRHGAAGNSRAARRGESDGGRARAVRAVLRRAQLRLPVL